MKFKCSACGLPVKSEKDISHMPALRYENCKFCKIWGRVILITAFLAFIFALIHIPFNQFLGWTFNKNTHLNLASLGFTTSGVCLLFGFIEEPILKSIGFGDSAITDPPEEQALRKHVWQTRLGWVFVMTGSILQGISILHL